MPPLVAPHADPARAAGARLANDYAARCLASGELAPGACHREEHLEALRALARGDLDAALEADAQFATFLEETANEIVGTLP